MGLELKADFDDIERSDDKSSGKELVSSSAVFNDIDCGKIPGNQSCYRARGNDLSFGTLVIVVSPRPVEFE
jgi:hypothetical protein